MIKKDSFRDFVFREHLGLTVFITGFLVLHFIFLKVLSPHTIVIGDGLHYIRVANDNTEISGWPIGYSKFLAGVHMLVRGDWIISFLQYILMEGTVVYFSLPVSSTKTYESLH